MGRPELPIRGFGNIRTTLLAEKTKEAPAVWQAEARYRDLDGVTRKVRARGYTEGRSIAALKAKMDDRAIIGGVDLTPETRVKDLAEAWFATVTESPGTRDTYRMLLDTHIKPKLGNNRLREVTTGRVEKFVTEVSKPVLVERIASNQRRMTVKNGGPTAANMSRMVLGLMFGMAVRHDAVATNPVRESKRAPAPKKQIRALTVEEFGRLRQSILEWQESGVMGPRKSKDLIDKVDLFVATGLRPGELLGLLWEDVDFDSVPPTIEVTGTIKHTKAQKLHRQAYPKSEHGKRILGLPSFAVKMLARRKLAEEPGTNPMGLIFPSRSGGVLDPGNFRRQWREARGEEFEWVTPGGFRKAVATLIEREAGSVVAARQLGHANDEITRRHYIERNRTAPDTTRILEQFGGTEVGT